MNAKTIQAIRDFLGTHPGAKRGDFSNSIAELRERDPSTLWRYLQKLKDEGLVRSEGDLKGTRYYLSVPPQAEPEVRRAVADIVRSGQTFALETITEGRSHVMSAVQLALDQLERGNLRDYGLTQAEFDHYRASRAPLSHILGDDELTHRETAER